MPPAGKQPTANHRILRMMRCVRGRIDFEVDIAPRFDYGRKQHETQLTEHGAVFVTEDLSLTLHAVREPGDERLAQIRRGRRRLHIDYSMTAGQDPGAGAGVGGRRAAARDPGRGVHRDVRRRHRPSGVTGCRKSTYTGRWREMLQRSAITLKLMTYAPTGRWWPHPLPGCPNRSAASATGTTATPGCGTPRSPCTHCSAWASPRRRPSSARGCGTASRRRPRGRAARSTSCTAWTVRPTWSRNRSSISRATEAPGRCGSATAPRTSGRWTSSARRWTASTSRTSTGSSSATTAGSRCGASSTG